MSLKETGSRELIINLGDMDYDASPTSGTTYLYSLGGGLVRGGPIVQMNDPRRLHEIATEIRDEYAGWIYSLNQMFLQRGLVEGGLSLFLVSDCSCKRTELFDTYRILCNLVLIKELLARFPCDEITIVGGNDNFLRAFKSICSRGTVTTKSRQKVPNYSCKQYLSDIRFVFEVACIIFFQWVLPTSNLVIGRNSGRYFFTIYPKMSDTNGRDRKYRDSVQKDDKYAASIITDGLHQHVSVRQYFRLKRRAQLEGTKIIDEFIRFKDWYRCLYWWVKARWALCLERDRQYTFLGIDLKGYIERELVQSSGRLGRFMLFKAGLERFVTNHPIKEFVYYLHEYPIGRLISFVLKEKIPAVKTCGYQHGPSSWRKLLYFMDRNETSRRPDYSQHVPIPDEIIAEDESSADIYRYAGYADVQVMDKIHRLDYLETVAQCQEKDYSLITPGLHDGEKMLNCLKEVIVGNPEKSFYFKPHPLSNNRYLTGLETFPNLIITDDPLPDLLSRADQVFVTYSSVGMEAEALGIPVRIVEIPGVINESPLGDRSNYETLVVSTSGANLN